jgi:hypothetical protein
MRRLGNLIRRMFVPRTEPEKHESRATVETRDATEAELDEAIDESFPASDPMALHLEKDR